MRYQNVKAFHKHLADAAPHHFSRLYLIAAPDDHERGGLLNGILSRVAPPDTPPLRCNGGETELREVFDALQSPSLLGGEPAALLDEAEKLPKKQMQLLTEWIASHAGQMPGFLVVGARSKTALAALAEKEGIVLDLTEEKPWDKEKRLADQISEQAKSAGKRIAPDAIQLLFEQVGKEAALLESEIAKLICYAGDRNVIAKEDVLAVSASHKQATLWQMAEEVVWEGAKGPFPLDANAFVPLVLALRSQLHLGLTLAALIREERPPEQWKAYLPKIWPKTLEKRSGQAARLGAAYFRKGLEALFHLETLSRGGSSQYAALFDFFRLQLAAYSKGTR